MKVKRLISAALAAALTLGLSAAPASAKTTSSAKADNIFFYATNAEGRSVLLKVTPFSELKKLEHGQTDEDNYYISTTDNYPTTQYCEARGFTVNELVDYVKAVTTVRGANAISFSGGDTISLMATDSYGNYSRSWTYDELYGVKRYYFEDLYDSDIGWNTGWEVAGTDNSKYGITLEEYRETYQDSDPYYHNKRAVFAGGTETTVILATESCSGRTTTNALTASTELGIADYIRKNGGTAAGCLKSALSDEYALRLSLPMTEADLMAAHRTAYDNFKWIYNLRLDMENAPKLPSQGTVAEPVPAFSLNGNTLTVTFSCATAGASIYYGYDGAPQTLYTGPITVDVTGRDLSADPVTVYAAAVREGYDDAGVLTFQYPGMAPAFQTVYSGMAGKDLTFTAAEGVSTADWTAWTSAISFLTAKTPAANGYVTVDKSLYAVDNQAKTITFDASLFPDAGSYSLIFHAARYADKNVSVTMKQAAPALSAPANATFGSPITITFEDEGYNSGLSVYVTPEGGTRTMIASGYLDRTRAGQVSVTAEYFTAASTAMGVPGRYTLELVNNGYSPSSQTVELTVDFTDVAPGAWYYGYVTDLVGAGVVNGTGGGRFSPKGTLTWGEAMKLLLRTCGYEAQAPTDGHWASGYMDAAVSSGLIAAGTDPDAAISRLEFCRAAAGALGAETTLTASPFPDTDDPAVLALYERGIIRGTDQGTFQPQNTLTRAEISAVIWRILKEKGTA